MRRIYEDMEPEIWDIEDTWDPHQLTFLEQREEAEDFNTIAPQWKLDDILQVIVEEGNGCTLLEEEYYNSNEKMRFQCRCGAEFKTSWSSFIVGNKRACDKCTGYSYTNWNIELIEEYLATAEDMSAQLISKEYHNCSNKDLEFQCGCGNHFKTSWAYFKYNNVRTCEDCRKISSRGEMRVKKHLDLLNITYNREHTFRDLRDKYPLRFDFALFNGKDLRGLVEYDGEQHFRPVDFGGRGVEESALAFEGTQRRDNIKNQYCINNKIPILRISFKDYTKIEELVEDFINEVM